MHRLELVRALREGGGLSIAAIAGTLAAMDRPVGEPGTEYLTTAVAALSDPVDRDQAKTASHDAAARQVDELLDHLGWDVDPASPGHDDLAAAVAAIHRFLPRLISSPQQLRPYADAVRGLADIEIPDGYDPTSEPENVLRYSVLGTVLFEPVLLALRKLAHVDRIRDLGKRS